MSKFRALIASSVLATALVGGMITTSGSTDAKAPINTGRGGGDSTTWCC